MARVPTQTLAQTPAVEVTLFMCPAVFCNKKYKTMDGLRKHALDKHDIVVNDEYPIEVTTVRERQRARRPPRDPLVEMQEMLRQTMAQNAHRAAIQPLVIPAADAGAVVDEQERGTCKVCMDRECNALLVPCHHLICLQCAGEWLPQNRHCPLCRRFVDSVSKVFL